MTKCNTSQLLEPRFEAYYNRRRRSISEQLDSTVRLMSTPGSDTEAYKRHRVTLVARLAELDTAKEILEFEETNRRQKELDAFEDSLNGTNERDAIIEDYDVSRDGIIHSPGKFEGEMLYAPYFWNWILESEGEEMTDADGTPWTVLDISDEDRTMFPEIHRNIYRVALRENDQGFVYLIDTSTPHFDELGTDEDREERDDHEDSPSLELEGTVFDPSL